MKKMGGKFSLGQVGQFMLAHVEKALLFGVGVFVLFLLIYQPMMGGSEKWKSFRTTAQQFQEAVTKVEVAHQSSRWSEDQKQEFEQVADIRVAVGAQKSQLDVARFEYPTPFHFSPYEKKQKDRTPGLLPGLGVLADASQVILRPTPNEVDDPEGDGEPTDGKVAGRVVGKDGDLAPPPGRSSVAPRKKRGSVGANGGGEGRGGGGGEGGGGGVPDHEGEAEGEAELGAEAGRGAGAGGTGGGGLERG